MDKLKVKIEGYARKKAGLYLVSLRSAWK